MNIIRFMSILLITLEMYNSAIRTKTCYMYKSIFYQNKYTVENKLVFISSLTDNDTIRNTNQCTDVDYMTNIG